MATSYIFRFGKHAGKSIEEVPEDYLVWLRTDCQERLDAELDRRNPLRAAATPMVEKIIDAGYRALALKHHPDKGGDMRTFQELTAAHVQLKEAVKAVR